MEAGTIFDRLRYPQPGQPPEWPSRLIFNEGGRLKLPASIKQLTEVGKAPFSIMSRLTMTIDWRRL
jgi:hypothetical protein